MTVSSVHRDLVISISQGPFFFDVSHLLLIVVRYTSKFNSTMGFVEEIMMR